MRLRVIVKAGSDEISSAIVSDRDPWTDVAQMGRAAYQLYRDQNGALIDPPTVTITVAPIKEGGS